MKDTFLTVAALWLKKKVQIFHYLIFLWSLQPLKKTVSVSFILTVLIVRRKMWIPPCFCLYLSSIHIRKRNTTAHVYVGLQFYDYFCEVAMGLCFSLFFFLISTTQCQIFFYVSIKHHVQWNFSELRLINIYIINSKIKVILLSLVAFGSCHCFCIMN